MGLTFLPDNFLLFNTYQSKNIVIVVQIPGVDNLSNITINTKIRYGDPGLFYGVGGFVYGGLRAVGNQRSLLSLEGLNLSQKLEPEQGRGSISQINLSFIDKDGYMSKVVSPGVIIDEILGKPVKIFMGYEQISFPEDYFVIFRGIITGVTPKAGMVTLQFSDTNIKQKQSGFFFTGKTTLFSDITSIATTIPVVENGDFHKKIAGPDGTYFSGAPGNPGPNGVRVFIKIDDEWIEYQQAGFETTGFGVNQFLHVIRGARGTTAAAHTTGATVDSGIEIQDHSVDMALKLYLSGWNGPYLKGAHILNIVHTGDIVLGDEPGAIILPQGDDADQTYGLFPGDFITITGASNGVNNQTAVITGFEDLESQPNRIIRTNSVTMVPEMSTSAVFSVRSQFDVYPVSAGAKLTGDEVDVAGHITLRDTFLSQNENSYRFFIIADKSPAKSFVESQIYLPMACYSLTRYGRISMGISKPPLADERLQVLDKTNILNATELMPQRMATQNRKFFNEVDYTFDYDDAENPQSLNNAIDATALDLIGISSVLPIDSLGSRTNLGFLVIINRRTRFFLQRYSRGAVLLNPRVNWAVGCQIEAGDIVAVNDGGFLQITNFATGQRNIGAQLFEVLDRSSTIKDGTVQLQLLGGVNSSVNDRYATISPSSLTTSASTSSHLVITESFGVLFPGKEQKKWIKYVGLGVHVHDKKYTVSGTSVITAIDSGNDHQLDIDPPLGFTPPAGYIVDIIDYPTDPDPNDSALYKVVHCFLDPSPLVTAGVSNFAFQVGAGDIGKFFVGSIVYIHNTDYSILSPEATVTMVDTGTNTVTVGSSLTFTPAAGQFVELVGFGDRGGPYRFI